MNLSLIALSPNYILLQTGYAQGPMSMQGGYNPGVPMEGSPVHQLQQPQQQAPVGQMQGYLPQQVYGSPGGVPFAQQVNVSKITMIII